MTQQKSKSFHLIKLIMVSCLITLTFVTYPFCKNSSNEIFKKEYYSKKLMYPYKGSQYPKKYQISKQQAKKKKIYFLIYKNKIGQTLKEENYINNELVSHYIFYYKNNKKIKEKYFDNFLLIHIKKYSYNPKGGLSKIEQYDKSTKNPFGDWVYFNSNGEVTKIERYRNKKLNYLSLYQQGKLIETQYFKGDQIDVTKFNLEGQVLSEEKISEYEKNQISSKRETLKVVYFKLNTVQQIIINKKQNRIILEKKNNKWVVSKKIENFNDPITEHATYEADNRTVKRFLKNLLKLKSFKTFEGVKLDKSKYGLTRPRNSIQIINETGTKIRLYIGDPLDDNRAYYLTTNNMTNKIVLVSKDRIDYIFARKIQNFRTKQIVSIPMQHLKWIQFDQLKFIKTNRGWALEFSKNTRLKHSRAIISTILNLRASQFIDNLKAKEKIRSSKSIHSIVLQGKNRKLEIEIYLFNSKTYVQTNTSTTIYAVPPYVIHFLGKKKKYFLKK